MSHFPDEHFAVTGGEGSYAVHCPEHGTVARGVADLADAYLTGAQHMNDTRHNAPVTVNDVPHDQGRPLLGGM